MQDDEHGRKSNPSRAQKKERTVRRRNAGNDLAVRHQRLVQICRSMGLGYWTFSSPGEAGWCSPSLLALLGIPVEAGSVDCEIRLRSLWRLIHAEDRNLLKTAIRATGKTGNPLALACRICGRDGVLRWAEVSGRLVRTRGRPAVLTGAAIDITRERQLAAALAQAQALVQATLEHADQACLVLSREGRIRQANRHASEMLRYTPTQLTGMAIEQLDPDLAIDALLQRVALAEGQAPVSWSGQMSNRDGQPLRVQFRMSMESHAGEWCVLLSARLLAIQGEYEVRDAPDDDRWTIRETCSTEYNAKPLLADAQLPQRASRTAAISAAQVLEAELRQAIEEKALTLHFQPRMHVQTRIITGCEALLRWKHDRLGLLMPDEFIPMAERTGLIIPLTHHVLQMACRHNQRWMRHGMPLRLAVNLSASQFEDVDLVRDVRSVLQETGMMPELLELEITEHTMMRDTRQTMQTLAGLKALGVQIALDDFGIAYSSLAYLNRLQVDTIKIDRSFINGIPGVADAAIVEAILSMGRRMDIAVVAEGVETQEQMTFLRKLFCDEIQGFYFSEPLDAAGFEALLLASGRACIH